jgi:hypothetical protein
MAPVVPASQYAAATLAAFGPPAAQPRVPVRQKDHSTRHAEGCSNRGVATAVDVGGRQRTPADGHAWANPCKIGGDSRLRINRLGVRIPPSAQHPRRSEPTTDHGAGLDPSNRAALDTPADLL